MNKPNTRNYKGKHDSTLSFNLIIYLVGTYFPATESEPRRVSAYNTDTVQRTNLIENAISFLRYERKSYP